MLFLQPSTTIVEIALEHKHRSINSSSVYLTQFKINRIGVAAISIALLGKAGK